VRKNCGGEHGKSSPLRWVVLLLHGASALPPGFPKAGSSSAPPSPGVCRALAHLIKNFAIYRKILLCKLRAALAAKEPRKAFKSPNSSNFVEIAIRITLSPTDS
jgi:hypothetical protein